MLDPHELAAEQFASGRFESADAPQFECDRDRARDGRAAGRKRCVGEPRAIGPRARPLAHPLQRGKGDPAALKHRAALGRVRAQGCELRCGRNADRIAQVERGGGVVFGMRGKPAPAGEHNRGENGDHDQPPLGREPLGGAFSPCAPFAAATGHQWKSRESGMIRALRGWWRVLGALRALRAGAPLASGS